VFSYQLCGLHVVCWFPGVIAFRVPLPFDQVLEFTSLIMMGSDSFDFILRFAFVLHFAFVLCFAFVLHFTFDHVRWWPREVLAVFFCFDVGREE